MTYDDTVDRPKEYFIVPSWGEIYSSLKKAQDNNVDGENIIHVIDFEAYEKVKIALNEQCRLLGISGTRELKLFTEIQKLEADNEILRAGLISISKNSCCDQCQQAKLVAVSTLSKADEEK